MEVQEQNLKGKNSENTFMWSITVVLGFNLKVVLIFPLSGISVI